VKPDLTFRRSLRMIAKRWWLLLAGGVIVAALAFFVVERRPTHYHVSTTLTIEDQRVLTNPFGPGLILENSNPKFSADWQPSAFLTYQAAQAASSAVGGSPSASQILAGLVATPQSTTQVQLDYTGGSNALAVLRKYAGAFITQRYQLEVRGVTDAVNAYNSQTNLSGKLKKNLQALALKAPTIPLGFQTGFETNPNPPVDKIPPGGPPLIVAVAGGFAAGAALAALLALLLGRMDKRVRRPDDIEVVGVPVVDVDSDTDPTSIQLLRSELELAGMGTRLAVIAVTRATRDEGSSGLALALARTFAAVGTPTVLVSADLRERSVRSETGLSAMLESSVSQPPLMPLANNLQWLPEGTSTANPETLFSAQRVERIVRALREQASVVVIDTPAVLEDAETLPLIACSDIVLLTVRPGLTMWNPLGGAITLIQRIAKRPLHICYDRAPERSSVPVGERSDVAERVHQAIEVPAG
jgi:hypothetical protein